MGVRSALLGLAPLRILNLRAGTPLEEQRGVLAHTPRVAAMVEEILVGAPVAGGALDARLVRHEDVEAGIHYRGVGQIVGVNHQDGVLALAVRLGDGEDTARVTAAGQEKALAGS